LRSSNALRNAKPLPAAGGLLCSLIIASFRWIARGGTVLLPLRACPRL
jgi:hypothetical protein